MERVVITGIGLVTPVGIGTAETLAGAARGRERHRAHHALRLLAAFRVRIAGEVKGWEPTRFIEKKKLKEMDRFTEFALGAAAMAVEDAKLELTDEERERAGCFIGVGLGGLFTLEKTKQTLMAKGPTKVSPYSIPGIIANLAAGQVSIAHGLKGPSYCTTSACSSGAHAIGEAAEWIRRGRCDVMVAGGAEATVTPVGIARLRGDVRALASATTTPRRASRPFDKGRDGFVFGEGSGIARPRVAHARQEARRQDLRARSRATARRATPTTSRSPRPTAKGAQRCDADGARRREASRPTPSTTSTRTAPPRRWATSRSRGHRGGLRGARDRQEALGELHQVDDGAPARRGRRGRDAPSARSPSPRARSRRRSTSSTRTRSARSTTSPTPRASGASSTRMNNSFGFGGTNCSLVLSRFEG